MPAGRLYTTGGVAGGGAAVGAPKLHRWKRAYTNKKNNKRSGGHKIKGPFRRYVQNDPFPIRKNVKLTYTQIVSLSTNNSTSLYGTEQAMRLNSPYDPDKSGTGHQPYGYDQLTPIYRRYKVNGVKFRLEFFDPTDVGVVCAASIVGTAAAGLTLTGVDCLGGSVQERPMSWSKFISDTGEQRAIVSQYMPISTIMNWTKTQYKNDMENTTSAYNASPALLPELKLAVASSRNTATAYVNCKITMTYFTTMYERQQLTQS